MKIDISTYAGLEQYYQGFNARHLSSMLVIGAAGLQKSMTAERLCPTARHLSGAVTAFELYREFWRHKNKDFIVDDVDRLFADPAAIRLLKSVADTKPQKTLHWHSSTLQLVKEGIPNNFDSLSRIIIIANEWRTPNRNVYAFEDRCHFLHFQPTAEEVHTRTKEWFKDSEVFEFIGANLHFIQQPSMRYYVLAVQLKAAGMDWRKTLLESWQVSDYTAEVCCLLNGEHLPKKELVELFQQRTGGCRATFFNIQRRMQQAKSETPSTFRLAEPAANDTRVG